MTIETYPLSDLELHKDHRRLRVFYHKGVKCVFCGRVGVELKLRNLQGALHLDVFATKGVLMTVDHIVPKSKGGSNELSNLQPACSLCNSKKRNMSNEKFLEKIGK